MFYSAYRTINCIVCSIIFTSVALTVAAQEAREIITLEPNQPMERELARGQSHIYQINLKVGEFLNISLDQLGREANPVIVAPSGEKIAEFDTFLGGEGTKRIAALALTSGTYRLEVRPYQSALAGRYRVKIVDLHMATDKDRALITAQQLYTEAIQLQAQNNIEARTQVLRNYEEAGSIWNRESFLIGEASVKSRIAYLYSLSENQQKAIEYYLQASTLWCSLGIRFQATNSLNLLGVRYNRLGEYQKALETFQQALLIFDPLKDANEPASAYLIAQVHVSLAYTYRSLGEPQKAWGNIEQTLALLPAVKDPTHKASIHSQLISFYSESDFHQALEHGQQTLLLRRALGDRKQEGEALLKLGGIYSDHFHYEQALDSFTQALQVFRDLQDKDAEARTWNGFSSVYYMLNEWHKGVEANSKALALWRALNNQQQVAVQLTHLGQDYFYLGDETKALDYFRQANQATSNIFINGVSIGIFSVTDVYSQTRPEKYREYLERALLDARSSANKPLEMEILWRMINTNTDFKKNNVDGKRQYEILRQIRAIPASVNYSIAAQALTRLSMYYAANNERGSALEVAREALQISQTLDTQTKASVEITISQVYGLLGDNQQALELAEQCWRRFNMNLLPIGKANIAISLARRLRSVGKLAEAKEKLEWAIATMERLYNSPTSIAPTLTRAYEMYADLLIELQQQQPLRKFDELAFQAAENAKSRSFLQLLKTAQADLRQHARPELLLQETELQQRIQRLSALAPNNDEARQSVQEQLKLALLQLKQIATKIKQAHPHYAEIMQIQQPNIAEIQKELLDANTVLLTYSLGEKRSFCWAITPDSFTMYLLPSRTEINKAARRVYALLTVRQRLYGLPPAQQQKQIADADWQYQTEAAALSQILLGPVASQLGQKRLLIVAPEALQYLPFGALPMPKDGGGRMRDEKNKVHPLIVDHEIISLPSVSVMLLLRQELANRKPAPKAVAVLADPVFSVDDPRLKNNSPLAGKVSASISRSATPETTEASAVNTFALTRALRSFDSSLGRAGLARLMLSRDEAQAISSAVPVADRFTALDFQANRANAMSEALSQYRIVHFATHGLLNAEFPELSGLVFSLVDEQGQPQDGFMRLHEIYNLKLPAELVVLSACQTGLGKEIKGEGLIGLTRGFMYAGAARVVASLWRVDDYATSVLMKKFYRGMLQEKLPAAAALRKAQIEMWQQKQWQSPFYWGAFVLQGEWR